MCIDQGVRAEVLLLLVNTTAAASDNLTTSARRSTATISIPFILIEGHAEIRTE